MKFRNNVILLVMVSAVSLIWSTPGSAIEADVNGTDNPWYLGISMTKGTYTLENIVEADINTFDFRLGREFNEYFSVEGRLGLGFNESDVSGCEYVNGVLVCANAKVRIAEYVGVYARGYVMPEGMFRPYAVLGFANGTASLALDAVSSNEEKRSTSGLSYGLGIETGLGAFDFTLEYLSLFDKDGESADGVNFGFMIDF